MSKSPARVVLAGLLLVFLVVLVRTAFVCDDSFITFRTVDNFVHGHGLRWNVDERVQTFTNPLWTLVLSGFYAVTGDLYYTSLALSVVLSLLAAYLVAFRIAWTPFAAALALTVMVLSKAFVDFSTSGLENALTHVLLAGFFLAAATSASDEESGLLVLSLLAGLAALNRLDNLLLVGPTLAAFVWRYRSRRALAWTFAGLAPIAGWELLSLVYYGFPLPNTGYAKLTNTGVPAGELALQGLRYLADSLRLDPITLPAILVAVALPFATRRRDLVPAAVGLILSLVWIVRLGGDFMSGRFLSAPLLVAMIVVAQTDLRWKELRGRVVVSAALALALLLGLAAPTPTILSGKGYGGENVLVSGIADIRRRQYPKTGLPWVLERSRFGNTDAMEGVVAGKTLRASGETVAVRGGVGYAGFYAGPEVHIIDYYALTDPFLARLPATRPWRIAHFRRELPAGYVESVRTGENRIEDPRLATLYDRVSLVTRGSLLDPRRFKAILVLNWEDLTGRHRD